MSRRGDFTVAEFAAKVDNTITVNGQPLSANVTLTKTDIGLGNVDNTSDANKPVSTAVQSALDTKQAAFANLTAIGNLTSAADKGIYFTGSGTAAVFDLSVFSRTLLDDTTQGAWQTTLGLVPGTNVQAFNSNLLTIAGLAPTTNNFMVAVGSAWASVTPTVATSLLNVFGADSGAGGVKGLVPATVAGDATKFLRGDGTWQTNASGTVTSVTSANSDATIATTTTTPVITIVSAPKLTTARTIGGVSFDGQANITVSTATAGFTVSGGNLALGTNSLTLTGSIASTGSRVTKGWFTDLEVSNAIVGSITGNAATVTTNANLTGEVTSVGNAATIGANNSAFWLTKVSDETGSGLWVFNTSPTLVTPVLGIATVTSINKLTITAPTTSATLTIADGKTLTVSNSLTLAGTDSTSHTFPSTTSVLARTDAGQTFTGVQTMTSPALTTPVITGLATGSGVATANTASTLVARDASGNFAAGTITATTQAPNDNSTKVATTAYVDSAFASFDGKPQVAYASTSALPANTYANGSSGVGATLTGSANGPLIIDGVTLLVGQAGERVLVAGEAAPANNGWYSITQIGVIAASPYILTRAVESDQAAEIGSGYITSVIAPNGVTAGSSNNGKVFISVAAADPFVVGTTSLTFSQVGSVYSAGTGLNLSGSTFSSVYAPALKSASTTVDVSAATAPSAGQVLTATDSTHATWQTPGGGGNTGTGVVLLSSTIVDLNTGTTKQNMYTVPANKRAIITEIIMHDFSANPTTAAFSIGWNASVNNVAFTGDFILDSWIPSTTTSLRLSAYDANYGASVLDPTPVTGVAADVLGLKNLTPEGSALTCIVDVFGYLTNTSGVPQANINVP